MKKLLGSLLMIVAFASCNSNSGTNNGTADSTQNNHAVENVNGNIPDTSNSTDITGRSKIDSSKIDSTNLDSSKQKK